MLRAGEDITALSAHLYGNYHKYYTFHPASNRTALIKGREILRSIWHGQGEPEVFRILDVGCNEGNLSMEVLSLASSELPPHVRCEVVGADIDPTLIELAKANHGGANSTFHAVDFLNAQAVEQLCEKVAVGGECRIFNLVTVFSTTMWIHINHGDEGLRSFLRNVLSFALPSPLGCLIVEPQPTKCYRSAVKRCRKLSLPPPRCYKEIKPELAEITVASCVLAARPFQHQHLLGQENWGRALTLFTDLHISVAPLLCEEPLTEKSASASDQ